ncbi:MAG: acyltransferase [Candidatus Omnitrophica bacterium]|nr:acyltransferase [Candidatus Omnitrophota bacterium]
MAKFLALLTNKRYWYLHSWLIKGVLRAYGIRIGRRFYIEGMPKLRIRGKASDIVIGDNVSIFGDTDFRNRESGKIIIEDGVTIDNDCRFVAANQATLRIGERTSIGPFSIFNAGVDILVGKDCMLAGSIVLQSSEHGIVKGQRIREQAHSYGEIKLGDDVWLAAGVTVTKGAVLEDGCVVGAKSLVRKGHYEPNSILVGIPARKIRERV